MNDKQQRLVASGLAVSTLSVALVAVYFMGQKTQAKPQTAPATLEQKGEKLPPSLDEVRERIDALDAQLVAAMAERAALVKSVAQAKRATGTAVYAPHREREVVERAVKRNRLLAATYDSAGLSDSAVEAVFRELMSGSIALQKKLVVGFLGPLGSFSHLAAVEHFGSSVQLQELKDFEAVVDSVASGLCDHVLLPVENSNGGQVQGAWTNLIAHRAAGVQVCSEAMVHISLNLLAKAGTRREDLQVIYSKAEAFDQCRGWLQKNCSDARLVPAASTSAAAALAAQDSSQGVAAIGSALSADLHGLQIVSSSIQDCKNNTTRFLVLGATDASQPTGYDRTTILLQPRPTTERPHAIAQVLNAFQLGGVKLLRFHTISRPRPDMTMHWGQSGCEIHTYILECEGHRLDFALQKAMDRARAVCDEFRVLGSHPRSRRVYNTSLDGMDA
eukprot:gb/GEZN01008746.1/.p1 GENE.gb/GEZN01008746.1/~~gb/GEZN01008746.1/.p1  ORF type:complete len:446 (+),score=59.87 gb/GEZN01008746.1/:49-1386(+)